MFAYTDFIPNASKNGGVLFALSNRYGGYSKPPYESLNLAFHTGDESVVVERNITHMLEHFTKLDSRLDSQSIHTLTYMTQIHALHCALDTDCVQEREVMGIRLRNVGEADALLLTRPYAPAMVLVADCNPILLFDCVHNIATLIHAGRAGVFGRICSKTLVYMREHYGTRASDVFAFVGVGIRKCCYEIQEDVCKELECVCSEPMRYIQMRENRYFLDLALMLADELQNLGIVNTRFLPQCSSCESEFFSYRRDGVSGRFALIAMLVG